MEPAEEQEVFVGGRHASRASSCSCCHHDRSSSGGRLLHLHGRQLMNPQKVTWRLKANGCIQWGFIGKQNAEPVSAMQSTSTKMLLRPLSRPKALATRFANRPSNKLALHRSRARDEPVELVDVEIAAGRKDTSTCVPPLGAHQEDLERIWSHCPSAMVWILRCPS